MRKWWPLVGICLGTFMLLVDVTIVTVAVPDMAGDLRASFSSLQWVLDGYALALAALLLGAGALADRYGRRAVYLAGLGVFAASSLACALAPSTGVLIAARVVQGLGGAAMITSTVALLGSGYRGRERGVAFGVWAAVSGGSAAVGPLLGGLLVAQVGWRAIFWVNLPVSIVAVIVTVVTVRESRDPAGPRVDLPGMAVFSAAAASVVYALTRAESDGWTSARILVPLLGGAALLAVFALVEWRTRQPMFDLRLFRDPAFTGIMLAALITQGAAFAYLAYTSLWVQSALGLGPVRAGLALAPQAGTAFAVALVAGRFLHGRSPRHVVAAGALLIGVGAFAQAQLAAASTPAALMPGLMIVGAGVGLAMPALVAAVLAAVPTTRAGMAGGSVETVQQFGFALSVALFGAIFQAHTGQVPGTGRITGAAFATGLNAVYMAAGIGGLAAAALVAGLVRGPRRPAKPAPDRGRARTLAASTARKGDHT